MKLRGTFDTISFFKAVESCTQEVCFRSPQGDVLNLKSTLSQYLFTFLLSRRDLLRSGEITCADPHDQTILQPFMEADNHA